MMIFKQIIKWLFLEEFFLYSLIGRVRIISKEIFTIMKLTKKFTRVLWQIMLMLEEKPCMCVFVYVIGHGQRRPVVNQPYDIEVLLSQSNKALPCLKFPCQVEHNASLFFFCDLLTERTDGSMQQSVTFTVGTHTITLLYITTPWMCRQLVFSHCSRWKFSNDPLLVRKQFEQYLHFNSFSPKSSDSNTIIQRARNTCTDGILIREKKNIYATLLDNGYPLEFHLILNHPWWWPVIDHEFNISDSYFHYCINFISESVSVF